MGFATLGEMQKALDSGNVPDDWSDDYCRDAFCGEWERNGGYVFHSAAYHSFIYDEVRDERVRAHAKHGDTSMEAMPALNLQRLAILVEEVGEVAKEFNEARHTGGLKVPKLRQELIQTAAMATAWADALSAHRHRVEAELGQGQADTSAERSESDG